MIAVYTGSNQFYAVDVNKPSLVTLFMIVVESKKTLWGVKMPHLLDYFK